MAGTSAMLTRKESAAMQKRVDCTVSHSIKGQSDSGDPQCHVPNSTRGNQNSAVHDKKK